MPDCIVIIPARLNARRFPRKLMQDATGRPMIWHTVQAAQRAACVSGVFVATDSRHIENANLGCRVIRTHGGFSCGTERVEFAAQQLSEEYPRMFSDSTIVINLQGDEPDILPADIEILFAGINKARFDHSIVTLGSTTMSTDEAYDQNTVKITRHGDKVAFSREYFSGRRALKHIGVYAFRWPVLNAMFMESDKYDREDVIRQRLEQLAWADRVAVVETDTDCISVNTPEDYERFVAKFITGNGGRVVA